MNDQHVDAHSSVAHPVIKVVTVWLAALGITSWGDFAAMLAALYSLLLIIEWCWKRFGRSLAEKYLGLKPIPKKRASDRGR